VKRFHGNEPPPDLLQIALDGVGGFRMVRMGTEYSRQIKHLTKFSVKLGLLPVPFPLEG
jgi:hypothetical protein